MQQQSPPQFPTAVDVIAEAIKAGANPKLNVTSNSMSPLLIRGDLIQIAPCQATQLQIGSLAVIKANEHLLVHRFWGIVVQNGRSFLLTRGDLTVPFDPLWPAESLLGTAVCRIRKGISISLDSGPAARCNGQITRLLTKEHTLFYRQHPTLIAVKHSARLQQPLLWQRLCHRVVRLCIQWELRHI